MARCGEASGRRSAEERGEERSEVLSTEKQRGDKASLTEKEGERWREGEKVCVCVCVCLCMCVKV